MCVAKTEQKRGSDSDRVIYSVLTTHILTSKAIFSRTFDELFIIASAYYILMHSEIYVCPDEKPYTINHKQHIVCESFTCIVCILLMCSERLVETYSKQQIVCGMLISLVSIQQSKIQILLILTFVCRMHSHCYKFIITILYVQICSNRKSKVRTKRICILYCQMQFRSNAYIVFKCVLFCILPFYHSLRVERV